MIFIETPAFERMREGYLNDDQYRLLQSERDDGTANIGERFGGMIDGEEEAQRI